MKFKRIFFTAILLLIISILLLSCNNKNDSAIKFENIIKKSSNPINIMYRSNPYNIVNKSNKYEQIKYIFSSTAIRELNEKLLNDLNATLSYYPYYSISTSGKPLSSINMFYYCLYDYNNESRSYLRFVDQINKEKILDLTELLPEYAPEYYMKLKKDVLDYVRYEGKIFAIPNNFISQNRISAVIRNDLIDKYNITTINTIEDLDFFLGILKKENAIPLTIFNIPFIEIFALIYDYILLDKDIGLVYKKDDPDINIITLENIPEYYLIIKLLYEWIQKEYIDKENIFLLNKSALINNDITVSALENGDIPVLLLPIGDFEIINSYLKVASSNSYEYVEYPLYKQKKALKLSPLYGSIAIDKNCDNPEKVIMFIEWIHAYQENYDLFFYGKENIDFTLVGDKYLLMRKEEIYDSPILRNLLSNDAFRDIQLDRLEKSTPSNYKENSKYLSENTMYLPHLGFLPDYQKVIKFVIKRKNIFSKIDSLIKLGDFTLEKIKKILQEIDKTETENIIALVEDQMLIWKENS